MEPWVTPFSYRTESDDAAPSELHDVDDRLRADDALRRARRGETLLFKGTFLNAKQLLAAMTKRLAAAPRPPPATALEAFRSERRARHLEHQVLSKLVVGLDDTYRLEVAKAPEVRLACEHAWGPATGRTVTPLKTLLGVMGAEAWRAKGLVVPGLEGRLTPFYGVYTPTRTEYVELLLGVKGGRGASVIDVGTGTGLLAFVLLQRGATSVRATDIESRAVECATLNALQLGWSDRFSVEQRPLFPDAVADLIVCNPPWIPEAPKNRFDRAVFDEGDAFITGFLDGVGAHLTQKGRALLIISNLAELLGLRPRGWLEARFEAAGLDVATTASLAAKHGKAKDPRDPLHAARSAEITTLYELVSRR